MLSLFDLFKAELSQSGVVLVRTEIPGGGVRGRSPVTLVWYHLEWVCVKTGSEVNFRRLKTIGETGRNSHMLESQEAALLGFCFVCLLLLLFLFCCFCVVAFVVVVYLLLFFKEGGVEFQLRYVVWPRSGWDVVCAATFLQWHGYDCTAVFQRQLSRQLASSFTLR